MTVQSCVLSFRPVKWSQAKCGVKEGRKEGRPRQTGTCSELVTPEVGIIRSMRQFFLRLSVTRHCTSYLMSRSLVMNSSWACRHLAQSLLASIGQAMGRSFRVPRQSSATGDLYQTCIRSAFLPIALEDRCARHTSYSAY